jgi:hypothetical protein
VTKLQIERFQANSIKPRVLEARVQVNECSQIPTCPEQTTLTPELLIYQIFAEAKSLQFIGGRVLKRK